MAGSVEDLGAPESWEVADLDESMNRLMLSAKKDKDNKAQELDAGSTSDSASSAPGKAHEDAANEVDQFLREALQNPRERLSILRMEQDVQKFIRDSSQHQFEFQQLPTSYLRLAAHRVAQHYSLQSMVLLDSNLLDGSGSRIIVRKTSETRFPMIRLADIPVSLPSEESSVRKFSIKQRPNRHSHNASGVGQKSQKGSGPKSVEERKEEYNRARARIFNNSNSSSGVSGRSENEILLQDNDQDFSLGISKIEVKSVAGAVDANPSRAVIDSSAGSSRSARSRTEKEPSGWNSKQNNRVAIFRDRDMERSDPDYDRNYDRYTRRFDPGFGFSGGPYTIQPTFTPAMNYNTEFPQLRPGHTHRPPQLSIENQHIPLPQHLSGLWRAPSNNPGIGYGHPETLMTPFSPNHVGAHSAHLQPPHYSGQRPGMPFIHLHEHVHSIFSQPHQQQSDASSELARPW